MRRIAASGAALVLLLAAAPVASADPGKANPGKSDEARAEHQATTKFWTKEKVRQAKPRDFVRVRGTDRFVPAKSVKGTKNEKGRGKPTPPPTEPPTEPPTDPPTDVTGESWEGAGDTDVVSDVTGKVLFQLGVETRGKNRGEPLLWVCSATAVEDGETDRALILTAAHCVYDNQINKYAENWMFIPDYDSKPSDLSADDFCESTQYGCWTSTDLFLHDGFRNAGGFNTTAVLHDYAFAVVTKGGKGEGINFGLLENLVGESSPYPGLLVDEGGVATSIGKSGDPFDKADDIFSFGYPAASPYRGKDLTYCRTDVTFDSGTSKGTYGLLGCDMTGGASGGGWYAGFDEETGSGTLVSVNSYSYSGSVGMYGPKFDEKTSAVFNAARDPLSR